MKSIPEIITDLPTMNLSEIAGVIQRDWGKKVYFGAVPYLAAMHSMDSIKDNYGLDDGKTIVVYFLANSSPWRGELARAVKAELNKRCKS